MRWYKLLSGCAAAAALAAPSSAWATQYFDFELPAGAPPVVSYVGGPSFTAGPLGVTANAIPRAVYQDQFGLGVTDGIIPGAPPDNDTRVDGYNPSEALTLLFNQRVQVTEIEFTNLGPVPTSIAIFIDGSLAMWLGGIPGNGSQTGTYIYNTNPAPGSDAWKGTQFTFAALTPNDAFKVGGIAADAAPIAPTPSAFAAGAVTLVGLFGATHLRRGKRARMV